MRSPRFFQRQLFIGLAMVLMIIGLAIASCVFLMADIFEGAINPEIGAKAKTAGSVINSLVGQAASLGIAPEKLVGVHELFSEAAKKYPEIAKFELKKNNKTLFEYSSTNASGSTGENHVADIDMTILLPIAEYKSTASGLADAVVLSVTIDNNFIQKLLREMALDLIVVFVVTLFISLELLYFLAGSLLADFAKIRAQIAALSSGAFVKLPVSNWLGVDLSRALDLRASTMANRYQEAEIKLRMARIKRKILGEAHLQKLGSLIAKIRSEFSFSDTHRGRMSSESTHMLGAMRAPFFLLLLADDLSRSFLPVFASELSFKSENLVGALAISPPLVASLPIFLFMLIVAISQPLLGGLSERFGRRRSFLVGAGVACMAHLLAAQSGTLLELLIWRSAGGAAWAIGFVAAQGQALDTTDSNSRTAGLAAFVGIIMVSLICGPSIGGLLADGLGHRFTIAIGGALTAISFVLAWRRLPTDCIKPISVAQKKAKPNWVPRVVQILTNWRFSMLLLLAAVPAKIILIAYCYYLIPLYVTGSGSTSAMAGRIIMLYSVMMVLLVPLMANWVVTLRARQRKNQNNLHSPEAGFVAAGLAISGLAGITMLFPLQSSPSSSIGPCISVLLLGLGQALSISPQAAMVAELCQNDIRELGQSAVYGVYRMIERLGNAMGPLIAATLLEIYGFGTAFVTIGVAVLLCAGLFAFVFLRQGTPSKYQCENEATGYGK